MTALCWTTARSSSLSSIFYFWIFSYPRLYEGLKIIIIIIIIHIIIIIIINYIPLLLLYSYLFNTSWQNATLYTYKTSPPELIKNPISLVYWSTTTQSWSISCHPVLHSPSPVWEGHDEMVLNRMYVFFVFERLWISAYIYLAFRPSRQWTA